MATLYVPSDLSGSSRSILWRSISMPAAGQRVGDVLRGDRAVELAALADLHAHRQGRAADPGRGDLGILALALALVLAARDVVLPRPIGAAGRRHGELCGIRKFVA